MVVIRLCLDVGLKGNGKGESENWAGLGWAGLDPSIGSTGSFLPVEDVSRPPPSMSRTPLITRQFLVLVVST